MTPTALAYWHCRQAEQHAINVRLFRRRGWLCHETEQAMRFHCKAALKVIALAGHHNRKLEANGMLLITEGRGW